MARKGDTFGELLITFLSCKLNIFKHYSSPKLVVKERYPTSGRRGVSEALK